MPRANVLGGGRDRRFDLPQYFTTIAGLETAFADSGPGKPAVVFIHGLAGNVTHWVNVVPHFITDYRVVAVDLPGHGESDKPGDYSIRMFVRHLIALLDRLEIEEAVLVGHSMGGMVATAATLAKPGRVKAAVLVNPAGMQPMPRPVQWVGNALLQRRLLEPLLPRVWKGILANVFYRDNVYTRRFIETCEETYDPRDTVPMAALMESLRRDLLSRDYAQMLSQIETPVWLIWGDKDRLVPAGFLRKAARDLPNVVVEEIRQCGHMPNIEQPYRVIRFLERALSTAFAASS